MRKTVLQERFSCSVQNTAPKNTKYSRNGTISIIGHLANANPFPKGYSLCKMVSLGQKLKMPKACEKQFYKNVTVVLCKIPLKKPQIFEK